MRWSGFNKISEGRGVSPSPLKFPLLPSSVIFNSQFIAAIIPDFPEPLFHFGTKWKFDFTNHEDFPRRTRMPVSLERFGTMKVHPLIKMKIIHGLQIAGISLNERAQWAQNNKLSALIESLQMLELTSKTTNNCGLSLAHWLK